MHACVCVYMCNCLPGQPNAGDTRLKIFITFLFGYYKAHRLEEQLRTQGLYFYMTKNVENLPSVFTFIRPILTRQAL